MCVNILRGAAYYDKKIKEIRGMKYICPICSYEYDPRIGDEEGGVLPRTDFEDLPENWVCPLCGTDKDEFEQIEDNE